MSAQTHRFTGIDPLLPAAVEPPRGDLLTAALPDGEQVVGTLCHTTLAAGTPQTLWSALDSWELHPLLGAMGGAGLDALLRQLPQVLHQARPSDDSSCLVTWPSRDSAATRVFLNHGFVPLSVLAVRTETHGTAPKRPSGLSVRRAGIADLDVLVELAMAEVAYSALVGSAVVRPDAADIRRAALRCHLDAGDPVWLAERDGIAFGHVEGWHTESVPGSWAETRVRHGRWGYVNSLSVAPGARGGGVGRVLMDVAHAELLDGETVGAFLYYNPPNPLSTTFWARQGYRGLWTLWEVRPANALR